MRYTKTHEWAQPEPDGIVTVGISDRAQQALGGIVFVELPRKGEEFEQDDSLGSIESIDGAVKYIYSPVTGEVIEVNKALENSPDLINRSPEGDGWLVKMRMEIPKELVSLMAPEEYEEYKEDVIEDFIEEEEEEEEEEFEDEEEKYF